MDKLMQIAQSLQGQVAIGAIIAEMIFRLIKTEKPLSIAHLVASTMHKAADIIKMVANFLDKILPQRTKE